MNALPVTKDPPRLMPTVIIPAGASSASQTTHFGDVLVDPFEVGEGTIKAMAGADGLSSVTSYWIFEIGYYRGNVWAQLAVTSTKPLADGGLGDLKAGHEYAIKHPPASLEWGDSLAVIAIPFGSPGVPCFRFALTNAALNS